MKRVSAGQRLSQGDQILFRDRTEQLPDGIRFDRCRQQAELVEQALRIAQASLGPLGHHMERFGCDRDCFLLGDPAEMLLERIEGDAAEVEPLTAAQDRGEHPLGVRRRQDEHHPRGGFLKGFEQCVERCGGEHVAFIHHIHLPAGLDRGEA